MVPLQTLNQKRMLVLTQYPLLPQCQYHQPLFSEYSVAYSTHLLCAILQLSLLQGNECLCSLVLTEGRGERSYLC